MRSSSRGRPLIGAIRGVVAAGGVAAWLLARGAANWLQAPYAFDIYALITDAGAMVLYLGVAARGAQGAAPPKGVRERVESGGEPRAIKRSSLLR